MQSTWASGDAIQWPAKLLVTRHKHVYMVHIQQNSNASEIQIACGNQTTMTSDSRATHNNQQQQQQPQQKVCQ